MRINRLIITVTAVLAGLFLSMGCGEPEDVPERRIPVIADQVSMAEITRNIMVDARLEGLEEALIYAAMPGIVEEVLVREGDVVQPGQQLVRLDTDQQASAGTAAAAAALSAARANADNASDNLVRLSALFEAEAVSEQQYDAAVTGVEAADAGLNQAYAGYMQARTLSDRSYIEAPFQGVVGRVWARTGNTAMGQPLISIVNPSGVQARVFVSEDHLYSVRTGLPAVISVSSLDGNSYPGVVTAASSVVDPVSGLVPVEIQFEDSDGILRPGMTGRISIGVETKDALIVPEEAILRTVGGMQVALVSNGVAEIRDVEVGIFSEGMVEIVSGLSPGDSLITRGQDRVADGSTVEVVSE